MAIVSRRSLRGEQAALRRFATLHFEALLPSRDMQSAGQSSGQLICVQSADLSVDLLPDNGGRVASIRCKRTGTEFLLSGSNYSAKASFTSEMQFEESDCAGMDECLPTVSISQPGSTEGSAPDHGDLWRHSWRVAE